MEAFERLVMYASLPHIHSGAHVHTYIYIYIYKQLRHGRMEAFGRLVGMALRRQVYINVKLSKVMLKNVMKEKLFFDDLEEIDADLHRYFFFVFLH
jgi:hypothetical protein